MSKVVIISDQHFGCKKQSQFIHDYFLQFYENVFFPYIKNNNIKTIIDMGDTFDNRRFLELTTIQWAKNNYYDKLYDLGCGVHTIVGNHTSYFKNTNSINTPELLLSSYSNIKVYPNPCEVDIGRLKVFFIPWINNENETTTAELIKKSKAKVAMGHLELNGFVAHKGHIMEDAREPDLFNKFYKVFSGHYHTRSDNGKIFYIGNPYEIYFNDVDEVRGFAVFDTETLEHEYVNNPYKLHYQLYYDENNLTVPQDLYNKIVKVIVNKKTSVKKFETFIEDINNQEPHELRIIENSEVPSIEDFQVVENEDTMSILNTYVDETEIELDRSKIKSILNEVYQSALQLN